MKNGIIRGTALTALMLLTTLPMIAQKGYNKRFWVAWGYNRTIFEASDIHLGGPGYAITVYKAQAFDRPEPFSFKTYLSPAELTIPQFNLRLGYNFNEKWYISFSFDHMKYVMDNNQYARVSGYIEPSEHPKFGGVYLNRWMPITEDFLAFEHTDGFNFYSFELWRRFQLAALAKDRLNIQLHGGAGMGIMVPRTDMYVMGERSDNEYHIAGTAMAVMAGPYIDWNKKFFLQFMFKPGFAGLPDILVHRNSEESASQDIIFYQMNLTFGFLFK